MMLPPNLQEGNFPGWAHKEGLHGRVTVVQIFSVDPDPRSPGAAWGWGRIQGSTWGPRSSTTRL